jgi:fucose permease
MSKAHSIYAWGVVGVIIISTIFIFVFGPENWQWLPLLFAIIPTVSAILFTRCTVPDMETPGKISGTLNFLKRPVLWLCVVAIFLGGAAECTMAQWCSGYVEKALGIKKVWGDVFGTAIFGLALALGRSLYAKIGKNVGKWLLYGAIGASCCYILAAISPIPFIGLIACAVTGFCVAMMWPGSLVVAERKIPDRGVFIFAMMASGGDLGASIGPQMIGLVTDGIIANPSAHKIAQELSLSPEQLGMKLGMLIGALFPIIAIIVYTKIKHSLNS